MCSSTNQNKFSKLQQNGSEFNVFPLLITVLEYFLVFYVELVNLYLNKAK